MKIRGVEIAGLSPFGLGHDKPAHYREMLGVVWENRKHLDYAWRILKHGVCDGCSLGPRGLEDDVIEGTHLCLSRLKMLKLNTADAMDTDRLPDLDALRAMNGEQLKALGRLGVPLSFSRGDRRLRQVTWDEALDRIVAQIRRSRPDQMGFFMTSRGLTNESYYAMQKLARLCGTNNIDLASRLCHAASVSGLEQTVGVGAPTCSLSDLIGTDLLVVFGSNLANNQPVTTKYLYHAKRAGTRIVAINPFREPGLERYWIPSIPDSAVFGTRLVDRFFQVKVGGDMAFISGVLKLLIEWDQLDRPFIEACTTGFAALETSLEGLRWEELEHASGLSRADMAEFARLYGQARTAVLLWSMGLTQHEFGTQNVTAVCNLALARGMVGRPRCGLMPIRGHSGVQGGGECGISPVKFAGGLAVNLDNAARLSEAWGHRVPAEPGKMFGELLAHSHAYGLDLLYLVGGNLYETMPDPEFMAEACRGVQLRVHQDVMLNTGTLLEGPEVLVLPAQTRYETEGGGTSTSTERRIRFSPHIPGHVVGQARAEWWIPTEIARRLFPHVRPFADPADVRAEMGKLMPMYAGIESLAKEGDWIQWGGPRLFSDGTFPKMPQGQARFVPMALPTVAVPEGHLYLTTRRGKQFNSLTYGGSDPLVGARRDDVFLMHESDARERDLRDGQAIAVHSAIARLSGRLRIADVAPGTIVGYWPRANRLIVGRYDPVSGQPDYNCAVRVEAEPTP